MEQSVLSDQLIYPSKEVISGIIGDKTLIWDKILSYLHENYSDITEVWKYYNDGKSWLFRTLQKKKTIYWSKIIPNAFQITFYFPVKYESMILESNLSEQVKEIFRTAKNFNTTRGLSLQVTNESVLQDIFKLIDLRIKIK